MMANTEIEFYIFETDNDCYSLFNIRTDKEIFFDMTRNDVSTFLINNNPEHPFLLQNEGSNISVLNHNTYLGKNQNNKELCVSNDDSYMHYNKEFKNETSQFKNETSQFISEDLIMNYLNSTYEGYFRYKPSCSATNCAPNIEWPKNEMDKQLSFSFMHEDRDIDIDTDMDEEIPYLDEYDTDFNPDK